MDSQSSVFRRVADVVTLRHIQRSFAFVWDVDLDGNEERDLLARYVSENKQGRKQIGTQKTNRDTENK
jgi:hypothetical protein